MKRTKDERSRIGGVGNHRVGSRSFGSPVVKYPTHPTVTSAHNYNQKYEEIFRQISDVLICQTPNIYRSIQSLKKQTSVSQRLSGAAQIGKVSNLAISVQPSPLTCTVVQSVY